MSPKRMSDDALMTFLLLFMALLEIVGEHHVGYSDLLLHGSFLSIRLQR
jgi:hypothetical protein